MHFFVYSQAVGPVKGNVVIQHDALVQQIKLDKWTVSRCIGCDSFCFATGEGFEGMLVNASLAVSSPRVTHLHNRINHPRFPFQRDQAQLMKMMNCDNYAMPFKIVLKPIAVLPSRGINMSISNDPRLRSMFEKLQDFIDVDTKQTESEIRRLSTELDQRRQKAERDFQRICAIIESSSSTFVSTKAMSTENIDLTPPVTPESINDKMMTIDQLPLASKLNGKRDGSSKHSSAISQSRVTKTINFGDDIFAFDGMQDDASNEADGYQKNSDSEDEDGEKAMEKRAYMRGRSGSINVARSAPISMPQFLHHVIHDIDTDDEKLVVEQEMDIPSSIQQLARSIHTDSVFGELPVRPILRHNEF